MAVQLTESNGGKTLEVAVSGTLSHSDYSRFVPTCERLVQQQGTIRVLFEMTDFHGWDGAALWERLVMVGDKSWEKAMSVFCRPFTTATIRYFDHAVIGNASEWLAAGAR